MKTLRYRVGGSVKPGILDGENKIRDASSLVNDWDSSTVTIEKLKSIKSIVAIRFVNKEPEATWSLENPREYGFYSNVNPNVDHPRWTQSTERRIGEFFRRPTLMFNGYGEEVSDLYKDMDLIKYY